MTILAIETTGVVCGVCIMRDGIVLGIVETTEPNIHDVQLAKATRELIDQMPSSIDQRPLTIDQIDVVAVDAGPGSFTGTRIGVSFAKGLTMLSAPKLLGITSLETIACGFATQNNSGMHSVACAIEGHREHVFIQRFEINDGIWKASSDIISTTIHDAAPTLLSHETVIGPGATALSPSSQPTALSAVNVAHVAHRVISHGTAQYADPLIYVPEYRQEFIGRRP